MTNEYRVRELLVGNEVLEALLRGVRTHASLDLPDDVRVLRIYQTEDDKWAREFRILMHSSKWPNVPVPSDVPVTELAAN